MLTVYSPHGKDLLQHYEQAFERTDSTVDVQWVDMGSQEVLDRLRAEAANPQADVWFGAPAEIFERAAKEGLLAAHRPTWASAVPDDARDPNDLWYGTYLTPEVIAYNSEAVTDAEAPKDWDEVLDPKWRGKIIIRDPIASGTMRAIFGAIIARELARTGSTRAGYDWLLQARREHEGVHAQSDDPLSEARASGRRRHAVQHAGHGDAPAAHADSGQVGRSRERHADAGGGPRDREGREASRDRAALLRVRDDAGGAAHGGSRSSCVFPLAPICPPIRFPRGSARRGRTMKTMPVDRQLLADSLDVWMRYWDANIRNRGKRS